jgi:uncharacterized protein (DUF58 family)
MDTRDLLKRIRRIEIATKRAVEDRLQGAYHSVFKGRGMDFSEVRAYSPGDEVRAIDWNVTARTGQLHVKRFVEERELTVMVVCDLSGSTDFGSRERTKAEVAAEIAALLAFSAVANGDRVGLVLFTDRVEKFVPPRKGRRHALRLLSEILQFRPEGRRTDLTAPLEFLRRALKRSAVAFLLSDFLEGGAASSSGAEGPFRWERALRIAARKHDLVPIRLTDRLEEQLPSAGLAWIEDPETGETILVDLSDRRARRRYEAALSAEDDRLRRLFAKLDLDSARVSADDADYVTPLAAFFLARARRNG